VELCNAQEISYLDAEERVFGIPHPEVGAALLQSWNFPSAIVEAVGSHHRPTEGVVLNQILQIADVIGSNDIRTPHDPQIDPLIGLWREKLQTITPPRWILQGSL
jgi:HD-like signal output (HDOD) protein